MALKILLERGKESWIIARTEKSSQKNFTKISLRRTLNKIRNEMRQNISYLNSFNESEKQEQGDSNSMFIKDNMTMNTNHRFGIGRYQKDSWLKSMKTENQDSKQKFDFNPRIMSPFDHFSQSRNWESTLYLFFILYF